MAVATRKRKRTHRCRYVDHLLDQSTKNVKSSEFYQSLDSFYRKKWGAKLKIPNVDGFPFDLYRLYDIVMEQGGWQKVSSTEQWGEIAAALGFNQDITVVSHAMKLLYLRYLSKYEQNEVIGEAEEPETDAMASRNRNGRIFNYLATSDCPVSVPPMNSEPIHYLATEESEYGRLTKSLLSGLPNEIDFAINILTLLSHPGPRIFKVSSCPALITILMAHVGIFGDGESSLNHLHTAWQEASGRDFLSFWKGSGISDRHMLRLAGFSDSELLEQFHDDRDLFNLPLAEFSTSDPISWRIFQILCIVRNLSFEEVNREAMSQNWPLIKFLLVCAACDWPQLLTSSLDTLSNLSYELDITTGEMATANHAILKIVNNCIYSGDKLQITRGMEIIAGLCNSEQNETIICEFFTGDVISQIFSTVCLKDVMVCVYTLEALYQISELGTVACELISRHPHAIDMLVDMTTVEAVSFGSTGLAGMKVVEFNGPAAAPPASNIAPARLPPTNTAVMTNATRCPTPPHHELVSSHNMVPAVAPLANGQSNVVQADPQQSKLDMLTVKWIRKNCIPSPGDSVSRGEVYAAYVNDMRTIYNSLSGSAVMFSNTLQTCFRDVAIKPCQKQGSSYGYTIEGIKFVGSQTLSKGSAPNSNRLGYQSPSVDSETHPQSSGSPVHRAGSHSHSTSPLSDFDEEEDDRLNSPLLTIGHQPRASTDSQGSQNSTGQHNHVKLEVCCAAVEARNILASDNKAHETKIVRVENMACRNPVPNAENYNPVDQIVSDESLKLDSTIDAVASGKNGINGQPNCNGVSYKHVNGVIENQNHDDGRDEEPEDEEMEEDELEADDEEEYEDEDMGADDEDDESSSMCSVSVQSSVNGMHLQPVDIHSNDLDAQPIYTNGHFSTSESDAGVAEPCVEHGTDLDASTSDDGGGNLLCEWDNCLRFFSSGSAMFYHCATEHINENTVQCKWPNCDNTLRSHWSLVTHIQDHHCNELSLRHAAKRRQEGNPPDTTQTFVKEPQPHMYTNNAAAEAIRRHAFTNLPQDVTDVDEGPVTRSIRLTSSLILRNLARYSSDGRRLLRRHESHLSWLALSKLESGIALSQCLAELQESHAL